MHCFEYSCRRLQRPDRALEPVEVEASPLSFAYFVQSELHRLPGHASGVDQWNLGDDCRQRHVFSFHIEDIATIHVKMEQCI
jgi:hypothetical protein